MPPERRAHPRHIPVETAYAALGAEFSKVGKISDFSLGGLSFEYLDTKIVTSGNYTIDIFLMDESFHMHSVHCKVVYDAIADGSCEAGGILEKRRCGVKFAAPSHDQKKQFQFFLSRYIPSLY